MRWRPFDRQRLIPTSVHQIDAIDSLVWRSEPFVLSHDFHSPMSRRTIPSPPCHGPHPYLFCIFSPPFFDPKHHKGLVLFPIKSWPGDLISPWTFLPCALEQVSRPHTRKNSDFHPIFFLEFQNRRRNRGRCPLEEDRVMTPLQTIEADAPSVLPPPSTSTMTIQHNTLPIPQDQTNHPKALADLDVRPDQSS